MHQVNFGRLGLDQVDLSLGIQQIHAMLTHIGSAEPLACGMQSSSGCGRRHVARVAEVAHQDAMTPWKTTRRTSRIQPSVLNDTLQAQQASEVEKQRDDAAIPDCLCILLVAKRVFQCPKYHFCRHGPRTWLVSWWRPLKPSPKKLKPGNSSCWASL